MAPGAPCTVAGMALALFAWPALATGLEDLFSGLEYDTENVIEYLANEFVGVRDCITVETEDYVIPAGEGFRIAEWCPSDHPHVVGWDTRQHEHLHARLLGITGDSITVTVNSLADAPGRFALFVGCARNPDPVPGGMLSRSALPSGFVHRAGPR